MIYLLYLLTLVLILLIFHQLNLLSFRVLPAFTPEKTNALEHEDLLTLLDKFNYTHDDGVCHGFTLTWAQEAALGFEQQFYKRLNMIKREKETLTDSLQLITEKIKLSRTLSKKEHKLNEIKPFLEAVCLAQSPEDYPEVYAQAIQQNNIDTIYKLIQLNLSKQQTVVKSLFSKTMSRGSSEELCDFLNQINSLITIKNQAVVVFSSEEHTVGFKKQADNTWLFMDINHLYEQSEDYPYQILTSEALCSILYKSLFETSEQLVFRCSFIAKTGQKKLNQQISTLDTLYPITAENLQISNCRGFGILALAVQNDDRTTVRKILRLHRKSPVISESEFENAFFYAAACNRLSIMSQLISIPDIDINMSCTNEDSALAVACRYGHESIVRLLLAQTTIEVDRVNSKGMTPLMLACRSPSTQNNKVLFKLLLAAGASLDLTNADGETASDIARNCDNETALNAIAAYSAKTGYKPSPDLLAKQAAKATAISGGLIAFLAHSIFNKSAKSKATSSPEESIEARGDLNVSLD